MRIVVGADHAGYALKETLAAHCRDAGHEVIDVGTDGPAPVDYPDVAERLADAVLGGGGRGLLICGSGVGAAVAANKVPGIRAGLCHDAYSARQGVEHDDINVLVLGARVVGVGGARGGGRGGGGGRRARARARRPVPGERVQRRGAPRAAARQGSGHRAAARRGRPGARPGA